MDNLTKKNGTSKAVSIFLSLSTAVWLSGAAMFMPMTASAITAAELQAQIQVLLDQIKQLQTQLAAIEGTSAGMAFSVNLKVGSRGDDVTNLQNALTSEGVYSGPVTGYFGPLTKAGVIAFQEKYADEILEPIGLTAGTGYVGPATREKLNELYGGEAAEEEAVETPATEGETTTPATEGETTTPTTPTTPAAAAGTLNVEAGVHPAAALFPVLSARVPFTVLKFTAPADQDITVSSLTVERTGPAVDAVFDGVLLLDENGTQIGLAKTLNSSHQAVLNEPFTVTKGTSRIMTLGGNAQTSTGNNRAGTVAYLSLTAVNAGTATISGTLPIIGTGHTVNETLTIGTVTMARGPLDPNRSDGTAASKEIGTTGYVFSSVKATAGSQEKVYLQSVRWNQSGSVTSGDLANVKTYVDGTAYDIVVSSDGKYYTTTFADKGLLIDKGAFKEVYIKGDIVGGSGRTVDFDLYRRTDLGLKGETYGYGITPPATGTGDPTDDSSNFSTANPWYDASQVSVSSGTITVSKATSVISQNIAINLANQPFGGFEVEVKGESIQTSDSYFYFLIGSDSADADVEDITNISLVDENGAIVGGPVNGTNSGGDASGYVRFTDTITYPVGKHTYTLQGKLGTDFTNNMTLTASTTPSSDWTSTGQTTGNAITESPTSAVAANQMTIKAGAFGISVSALPLAQSVIAGTSQYLFANYVMNAGNSGEDISINTFPFAYFASANPTKVTNCKLYDGSTVLTSGSNVVSPSASGSSTSFTFDTAFTIPKGSSKTVSLKCDVAGSAVTSDTYMWGYDDGQSPSVTGKVSGQSITGTALTETESPGQTMAVAGAGDYSISDDSTTGYTVVSSGTTGVTLLKLKFSATTENVSLQRVNFEFGGVAASNTPNDLVGRKITLYDAASPTTSIGEAVFSTGRYATSTLLTGFTIPAGGSKSMLVKGDIAAVAATVGPLTASGDLLIVKYDGHSNGIAHGNYGVGSASGQNISPTSGDVTPSGVRIMKAYPSFAKVDLSTSERLLQTVSGKTIYKFKVTANGNDLYIYKATFTVSSSSVTATTSNYALYSFTDSGYSTADTSFSTTGLLNAASCSKGANSGAVNNHSAAERDKTVEIFMNSTATACGGGATTTYKIAKDATRWFELRADVATVESGTGTEYITIQLEGDATYTGLNSLLDNAVTTDGDANDDFIWSPNSTTTTIAITDGDFTNGYGIVGLPGTNMSTETLTSAN